MVALHFFWAASVLVGFQRTGLVVADHSFWLRITSTKGPKTGIHVMSGFIAPRLRSQNCAQRPQRGAALQSRGRSVSPYFRKIQVPGLTNPCDITAETGQ